MSISSMILNTHPEPFPGFKFKVYIQGMTFGFTKISNLEESVETEPFHEGGVNDRVYSLLKPVTTERTLIMERGFAPRGALYSLVRQFQVGQRLQTDMIITVAKTNGDLGAVFLVHGAFVKKINYGELNSLSREVMIQRFELSYEILEPITMIPDGIPEIFI